MVKAPKICSTVH